MALVIRFSKLSESLSDKESSVPTFENVLLKDTCTSYKSASGTVVHFNSTAIGWLLALFTGEYCIGESNAGLAGLLGLLLFEHARKIPINAAITIVAHCLESMPGPPSAEKGKL